MIEELRLLVKERWRELESSSPCEPQALLFTKFCQRIVGPHTKVLFLVTHHGESLCVIKMMRNASFNTLLKREKAAQETVVPYGSCRVPKVYFDGFIGGLYVYAEEVVYGLPLTRRQAAKREREIVEFVRSLPTSGSIEAGHLAMMFEVHLPHKNEATDTLIRKLRTCGAVLGQGLTHGDFGAPNILANRKESVIIDWAHANERPVHLIDAVYYMIRSRRIRDFADWHHRAAPAFVDYTGVDVVQTDALYAACMLFELCKKRYPDAYISITKNTTGFGFKNSI